MAWNAFYALGIVAVHDGRYDEAASWFGKAGQANSSSVGILLYAKACALALAGRLDEAATAAKQAMEVRPGLRMRLLSETGMAPSIAARFIEGARLLALPE